MALNSSPPPQPIAKSWCYTLQKERQFSFMWTINNFSDRPEKMDGFLKSSTFSDGNHEKMRWCLHLYPNGSNVQAKDFVSVYIHLVSCDITGEVQTKFKFSILNDAREEKNVMKYEKTFVQGGNWGWQKFISRNFLLDKANRLLPDNNLTLYCEVSVVADSINISGQKRAGKFRVPESHLSDDFGQVFDSRRFTDVILCVNGHEFAAHKGILAARSRVFSAMFEHEMEEKKQNRVEIIDMNHEVMRALLHYIYTDKVSDVENMTDLLFAADKYALERLKIMCEEHIASKLSVTNAAEVLIIADMHSADQLKAHVIDFITMYTMDVMETPGWRAMEKSHPQLVVEAFQTVATQQIEPPQKRRKL